MPPASLVPATYKDLCVDAADPVALGRFWSAVLGWRLEEHDDGADPGDADLRDDTGRVQVWLNRVPEPKSVKNRLHLDVGADVDDLLALGATRAARQPEHGRWTVLHDPDGQELCAFPDGPRGLQELCWDTGPTLADATRAATWWAGTIGGRVVEHDGWTQVVDVPGAPFSGMAFNPVPEPRTTKNRVHVDVLADDVGELVARGATVLRRKGDGGLGWHVLADPDGNELCVFDRDAS